ncbi:hypothetical protein OH492_17105 [Vibrio chagasii]|nr:hypothetical protein [Vibrio chagasii]
MIINCVAASFLAIWYVAVATRYRLAFGTVLVGVFVNAIVAAAASLLLTGKQKKCNLYTVKGQQAEYARLNKPIKEDGWYVVPGKHRCTCWGLLVMFVFHSFYFWELNCSLRTH